MIFRINETYSVKKSSTNLKNILWSDLFMAKRGHNEGTVFERKDRPGTWRAEFSYEDPVTGKTKRKKFDRPSRKEAMDAGKEWIKQIESGLLPAAGKLTLGEWIDRWLEDFIKPSVCFC